MYRRLLQILPKGFRSQNLSRAPGGSRQPDQGHPPTRGVQNAGVDHGRRLAAGLPIRPQRVARACTEGVGERRPARISLVTIDNH